MALVSAESLAVLRTELLSLVRDRRAFVLAVVLPMLLYPLLFAGMDRLESAADRSVDEKVVRIGHDLSALPDGMRIRLLEDLSDEERKADLLEVPAALVDEYLELPDEAARERWSHVSADLIVAAQPDDDGDGYTLRAAMNGSDTLSRSAHERLRDVVRGVAGELADERLLALAGEDPARPLALESVDLARPEDASGLALGKLLPLLAVLMLISGGSFAALGAFAGEREAGTLETLFVQPVEPARIAHGKFAAVLLTALVALVGNALSFLACLALGIGQASFLPGFSVGATGGRLALGIVLFLPTALLLSALLCWISARARSFREGQHYILPLALFSLAPAALATVERVELSWLLALVPIAGSALALRDALSGALALGPALLAFAAGGFWAWLALGRVARTLDAERLLATPAPLAERGARQAAARRAVVLAVAAVLLVYVVGGRLQAWRLVPGLALTLVVLLPLLTVVAVRALRPLTDASVTTMLALGAPRPAHLLGAALLAPALALASGGIFELQSRFLPVPEELALLSFELSWPTTLLLLCLAPALFEELLFRGALLFGLRHDWSAVRTCLWQGVFFGAVHSSVYRFLPTGVAGAVLAAVTLRTRSLWPAVVLHAGHNAWLAFAGELPVPTWAVVVGGVAGALALLARRR